MPNHQTISQRTAKEQLGNPEQFKGGCVVTKNGVAELFIQTAQERLDEEKAKEADRQAHALLKLTMMAKDDVLNDNLSTKEDVLAKLRASRR